MPDSPLSDEDIELLKDAVKDFDDLIASVRKFDDAAYRALSEIGIHLRPSDLDQLGDSIARLTTEIVKVAAERDETRRWVRDLQSGMWINCVYCGHRYGPSDADGATIPSASVDMAEALQQHIAACEKHPLSKALAERDAEKASVSRLRDEVDRLKRQGVGLDLVPQMYGDAVGVWGYTVINCDRDEWDNRTTTENTTWLLARLREEVTTPRSADDERS